MSINKIYTDDIPQSDKKDVVTGIDAVQFYLKNQEDSVFRKFRLNSLNIALVSVQASAIGHILDFVPQQGIEGKERTRGFIVSSSANHSQKPKKKKLYVSEVKKQIPSSQKERPCPEEKGRSVRETLAQITEKGLTPKLLVIIDFPEQQLIVYSLVSNKSSKN